MLYGLYAALIYLSALYVLYWIHSWELVDLRIKAWARADGYTPTKVDFPWSWKHPDLGQSSSQRIARLSVRDHAGTATFWVAYGPCYLGLTLATDVSILSSKRDDVAMP